MKALLHDCPIPLKKPESEHDHKNSFSFKETQLKQSFEKEKKLIGKQCETLRAELEEKDNEILELKDTLRLQSQNNEMLKLKLRDADPSVKMYKSDRGRSKPSYKGGSQNDDLEADSVRISGTLMVSRSSGQGIQPYEKSKKGRGSQDDLVQMLQEENAHYKAQLEQRNYNRDDHEHEGHHRRGDNDGTVVIGGASNMNMNTIDENDVSMKNCNINMSPIEERKDVSRIDEAILGVLEHSGHHQSSKRKLDFGSGNEDLSDQDFDLGENRPRESQELENELIELRDENQTKDRKIKELTARLQYYTSNRNSKDLSSPRFIEPEYVSNERV